MYRNCVYNNKSKSIHLFTWDAYGNRVTQELDYSPYLYLESRQGDELSIYDTKLKKREFNTLWDRNKFVKESGITRIFENIPPYQQFLIDNFNHCNGDDDFSQYPIKVMFLDIECPGVVGGKFPEPELAENVIDLLTVYDTEKSKYTVFGLKPYDTDRNDVEYIKCKSEHDLLKRFIGFFSSNFPDVLCGYNSNGFDIPYLINRITFELDEGWANELSPVGRIYEKINQQGKFGAPSKEYVIEGISCVDYFVMYKKFAMQPLESYKLDYVAEVELNENKVSYNGSLAELCIKDWTTYVDYNIQDVEILVKLDDKLRYIELLRFISYLGLCNMENAVKTVPVINGAVAIQARHRGMKIPTFVRPQQADRIPGAYVAEPKRGFNNSIVSFDANSLYPSVMITGNMSPETKVGSVEKIADTYHVRHVSGRTFELSKEKYLKYIAQEQLTRSESNILFTQKKLGIMPEFLDFLYGKRKLMKGKMNDLRKSRTKHKASLTDDQLEILDAKIQKYDTFQHAYKITLNSTYGYCANKYAPLGDLEIGASVTLTGQAVIKKSNEIFKDFIQKYYPEVSDLSDQHLVYNDTDSVYVSLELLENAGVHLKDENGKITDKFFQVCDEFENFLNDEMTQWAKKRLWSKDPRFIFKREVISDTSIFIGKKYYVCHILDDEGVPVDKYKYKGVDVVKSTMPKAIKPYVKRIIEEMMQTQSLKKTNAVYMEAYDKFKELGVDNIYKNSGINNYEKYSGQCNGLVTVKGMPAHVKAAYYHDYILEQIGASNKYPKFRSGDKVKSVYVKTPNRYGVSCIGFKGDYPEEFEEIFEIDYELMFNKILFAAIERFYDAVDWKLRKPNENVKIELEDFFGE